MTEPQHRLSFFGNAHRALIVAVGLVLAACGNGEADSATAPVEATPDTGSMAESTEPSVAALGDMALGPVDAPVTVIEYASLTCSHCASFHKTTFKRLKDNFIDSGRIRFILRDFPLDQFAMEAAVLARCAGEDKYFDVAGTLFDTQADWAFGNSPPAIRRELREIGEQYGVSEDQYEACLADEALQARITARMREGQNRFGVNATPTIIIDGERWDGSRAYTEIAKHLVEILPAEQ